MKLLKIAAEGLPLFNDSFEISFAAAQRVSDEDKGSVHPLFSHVYLNPTLAFIGINGSGKTSALKLLDFVLHLLNNEPVNQIETKDILGKEESRFSAYFYAKDKIYLLKTKILYTKKHYVISEESLYEKKMERVKTRKTLFDFKDSQIISIRNPENPELIEDVSIIREENMKRGESLWVKALLSSAGIDLTEPVSPAVLSFLDPALESLFKEDQQIHLKFKEKEEILLNKEEELKYYLSSGTIKGIQLLTEASKALKAGGYLLVDELEAHLNREVVTTLIRFFDDIRFNKAGAALVYTTQEPELLDEYNRNDTIYIVRNSEGIRSDNLSTLLNRNDIKKSEVYRGGTIEGTGPAYEACVALIKSMMNN